MDLAEYKRLLKQIEVEISSKREAMEIELSAERGKYIHAINTTWKLANKTEPPVSQTGSDVSSNIVAQLRPSAASTNGNKPKGGITRNERVRSIIRAFESGTEITARRVLQEIAEVDPLSYRELETRTTIISKLLRELANKGEVEKIQAGSGNEMTVYRKL